MTSPALTLTLMILGWLAVAVAMLWGMLRIAKRHQADSTQAHPDLPRAPVSRPALERPGQGKRKPRAHHITRLTMLRHRHHWATSKH